MKYYHINRLQKLANVLKHVSNSKFNMRTWGKGKIEQLVKTHDCNTAACALGWACSIPAFRKAGLHRISCSNIPRYKDYNKYEAAVAFFGISTNESLQLFHYDNPGTPKQIAKRIETVIKAHKGV